MTPVCPAKLNKVTHPLLIYATFYNSAFFPDSSRLDLKSRKIKENAKLAFVVNEQHLKASKNIYETDRVDQR